MSWSEIKYAVNSGLGTERFKPIDELIIKSKELVASDEIYQTIIDGEVNIYNTDIKTRFEIGGTINLKYTAKFDTAILFIKINGQTIKMQTGANEYTSFTETITVSEGDILSFKSHETLYINSLTINAKTVDKPLSMPTTAIYGGIKYSLANGKYSCSKQGTLDSKVFIKQSIGTVAVKQISGFANGTFTNVYIPKGIENIAVDSFANCTNLTSVYLPKTIKTIGENAFTGCTKLTVINCGFSQGEVSGAPWGAGSITINYNAEDLQ